MQSLLRLLLVILSVVSLLPLVNAEALPDARQDVALTAKYQSLDRDAQKRFLQHWLVDRFDKASRPVLSNADRKKQAARYEVVLRRHESGKSLSPDGLNRLLGEIARLEQTAIDQLALRYRVQVYSQFRTNRVEYDQRMATWRNLMDAWERAGTRVSDGAKVVIWLQSSLERMRYDESAKLPTTPRFGDVPEQQLAIDIKPSHHASLPSPTPNPVVTRHAPTHLPNVEPPLEPRAQALPDASTNVPIPERIAHRVEKPPTPEVEKPPRAAIEDVRPVVAPTDIIPDAIDPLDAEPRVTIDLHELAVRIRGHNLSLKELTGSLHEETPWTIDRLSSALAELTDLADRRAQISLYRDVVSAEEQKQAGDIASLDAAVALLGAKIFALREQLLQAGQEETSPDVSELNDLSRKLAQLASQRAR
jgi:hypothetical protein